VTSMDELAQMIFGFQCCSAAQEERESHLADRSDFPKQKKSRGFKRSKQESKSKLAAGAAGQRGFDDRSMPSHDTAERELTNRTDSSLSCKSWCPSRASIAADNALVGESRCPASGSLNSRSAFASTPPPESSYSSTRFHSLPRVITVTPASLGGGQERGWQDSFDLGTESQALSSSIATTLRP
jgi:hypothetical protein